MGKSSSWRPKGNWKNKARRTEEGNDERTPDSGQKPDSLDPEDQTVISTKPRKGPPYPKHCRGLVHVALCIAYTGTPFRGLQIQTHMHISHTVEGTLLLALKRAGYLLDEDFTPDGSRLRYDGGIRILTEEEAAAESIVMGGANVGADMAENVNTGSKENEGDSTPKVPPHVCVHKHPVPPHLQHLPKRQRKKYDPCFNPDGKFQFSRSCRTDKGVHAVRNIVSLYLRERDWRRDGNEGMAAKINASIPIVSGSETPGTQRKVMQVLAVTPVLPSFNAKECCNSRVYRYLIPLYALGFPVASPCGPLSANGESSPPEESAAYYNGSAIDDWERLFSNYPEFLEKGRTLAANAKPKEFETSFAAKTTWLPNPSELLRGHSALVLEGALKEEYRYANERDAFESFGKHID